MSLFQLTTVIADPIDMWVMLFLALSTSCLAAFFQKCMGKNMIFEFYRKLLEKVAIQHEINEKEFISSFWNSFLFKIIHPLGYCIYCNGFWIGVGIWFLYYRHFSLTILMFEGFVWLFTALIIKLKLNKL